MGFVAASQSKFLRPAPDQRHPLVPAASTGLALPRWRRAIRLHGRPRCAEPAGYSAREWPSWAATARVWPRCAAITTLTAGPAATAISREQAAATAAAAAAALQAPGKGHGTREEQQEGPDTAIRYLCTSRQHRSSPATLGRGCGYWAVKTASGQTCAPPTCCCRAGCTRTSTYVHAAFLHMASAIALSLISHSRPTSPSSERRNSATCDDYTRSSSSLANTSSLHARKPLCLQCLPRPLRQAPAPTRTRHA